MYPRKTALPLSDGKRFHVLDFGEEIGPTCLKLPGLAASARLSKILRADGTDAGSLANLIELGGLVIGLCWNHRTIALDTVMPARLRHMTSEQVEDYSAAVLDELADNDMPNGALLVAAGVISGHMISQMASLSAEKEEAEDLADFTEPPEESLPS